MSVWSPWGCPSPGGSSSGSGLGLEASPSSPPSCSPRTAPRSTAKLCLEGEQGKSDTVTAHPTPQDRGVNPPEPPGGFVKSGVGPHPQSQWAWRGGLRRCLPSSQVMPPQCFGNHCLGGFQASSPTFPSHLPNSINNCELGGAPGVLRPCHWPEPGPG